MTLRRKGIFIAVAIVAVAVSAFLVRQHGKARNTGGFRTAIVE